MAVTESALEAKKSKIAASQEANEEKINALNEQCDQKVKEIQEKRKSEIDSVKAKCKEQVDALKEKNKELQKQWNELEDQRVKLHGKNVGDLFNQFVSDNVDVELVKQFLKSRGGQFEEFLNEMKSAEEAETKSEDPADEDSFSDENPEWTEENNSDSGSQNDWNSAY